MIVAIKDFKLPESCSKCPFNYDYQYCEINTNAYNMKYKWTEERSPVCPLVEIGDEQKND